MEIEDFAEKVAEVVECNTCGRKFPDSVLTQKELEKCNFCVFLVQCKEDVEHFKNIPNNVVGDFEEKNKRNSLLVLMAHKRAKKSISEPQKSVKNHFPSFTFLSRYKLPFSWILMHI